MWANGEELSLSRPWIGQTEFIVLVPHPSSACPSAVEAADHSALRRVRRGARTRATPEVTLLVEKELLHWDQNAIRWEALVVYLRKESALIYLCQGAPAVRLTKE